MNAKLGDRVRDRINGFEGIVTGAATYLYGCVQVLVAPEKIASDGKIPESCWLDEDRVEVIAEAIHAPGPAAIVSSFGKQALEARAPRAGGPQKVPPPIR